MRGGTSGEYAHSLQTGAAMLAALPDDRYDTRDIFIDRTGLWHARGIPTDPARALAQIDVVINALHGGVGEDGSVLRILERAGVAYTGSRPHAAALAHHKARAHEVLQAAGIRVPQTIAFGLEDVRTTADMAREVFAQFGPPYVVKPAMEGGGAGILIAETIVGLPDIIADVLDMHGVALVQEFVRGREAHVAIIENFRDQELYALPPARLVLPAGARMHDLSARVRGVSHIIPSDFTHAEKEDLEAIARAAHKALTLSHFSRADIIVSARGIPYLLEVNTTPKLHDGAPLPAMLEAIGSSVPAFLEHQIALARA